MKTWSWRDYEGEVEILDGEGLLLIPLYGSLTDEQAQFIVDALNEKEARVALVEALPEIIKDARAVYHLSGDQ